jgi:hypothetical protein
MRTFTSKSGAHTATSAIALGTAPGMSASVDGSSLDFPPVDGAPLPPDEFAAWLWKYFRIQRSPRRLAQLRMSGHGPPFVRDGCVVRYPLRLAAIWAVELLGEPVSSTSEENARRLIERPSGCAPEAPTTTART